MNDAQLDMFRKLAEAMRVPADRTWNWCGPQYIRGGLTRQEAEEMVRRRGCGTVRHDSEFGKGVTK